MEVTGDPAVKTLNYSVRGWVQVPQVASHAGIKVFPPESLVSLP